MPWPILIKRWPRTTEVDQLDLVCLEYPKRSCLTLLPIFLTYTSTPIKSRQPVKLLIFSLSTPVGRNWTYCCSMNSGFWDTDWFSTLPYLSLKLGHYQKFQKLHISFPVPPIYFWRRTRVEYSIQKLTFVFKLGYLFPSDVYLVPSNHHYSPLELWL